jgi:two-component system LytT family response regulator
MIKYKCIVVEDNILERDALAMKLKKIDSLMLKAALSDGMEAVTLLKAGDIDIVFSDIDMPDLSGIELLKSLKNPPVFIFISSHAEHAAESFELDVIDYIVKPAKIERLIKATNKAIEYIQAKRNLQAEITPQPKAQSPSQAQAQPVALTNIDLIKSIDAQDYFFIKEKNTHIKLNMGDVLYIESMGDFSKIITTQQKTHFVLISLKNLEKQLPEKMFMRVHKQYIINILHVQNISVSDIKLTSNDIIPVSIAYKQSLLDNVVNKKSLTRFSD